MPSEKKYFKSVTTLQTLWYLVTSPGKSTQTLSLEETYSVYHCVSEIVQEWDAIMQKKKTKNICTKGTTISFWGGGGAGKFIACAHTQQFFEKAK